MIIVWDDVLNTMIDITDVWAWFARPAGSGEQEPAVWLALPPPVPGWVGITY